MPPKGHKHTDEAKQKLREARKRQVSPKLLLRGLSAEEIKTAEEQGLRWCAGKCKAFLPPDRFADNPTAGKCRICIAASIARRRNRWTDEERKANAEYLSQWRIAKADKVREAWLLKKYGVTPDWYRGKLEEQDGHCALCEAVVDGRKLPHFALVPKRQFLLVDHNHETGKPRGLLCAKCNTALNRVEYIQDWAHRALAYLEQYR